MITPSSARDRTGRRTCVSRTPGLAVARPAAAPALALARAIARPLALPLALALAPTLAAAQGGGPTQKDREQMERPKVSDVRLEGVRSVDRGDLADALATKESGCASFVVRPICLFTKSSLVYEHRYLDRPELARDVVRIMVYYYRRGWRDVAVDTTVARDGANQVKVTFTVREGLPTRVATMTVDDPTGAIPERRLRRLVRPHPGDPLNLLQLDSTVLALRDAYFQRGFGEVQVGPEVIAVDSVTDSATVRIPVQRGPFTRVGPITVVRMTADSQVSVETIRHSLTVKPGDPFRLSELARSQRNLYESGFFRSAVLDTAVVTEQNGRPMCASQATSGLQAQRAAGPRPASSIVPDTILKPLVICVAEGPLRDARTSVGFTTADFGQVEGRFGHNYWLGGPRRLEVSGVLGNLGARQLYEAWPFRSANGFNVGPPLQRQLATSARYFAPTWQVGADVRERWFRSPRNTIGAGVFAHRRSSPGVFIDRGFGSNASFTRDVSDRVPLSATYRFEANRVEAGDLYFCVNYAVCDRPTVEALAGQQRLSPVALTASVNRATPALSPVRGMLGRASLEYASTATLSDFSYVRGVVEASTYRRIGFRRSVLAVRARAGYVRALAGTNEALGIPRDLAGPGGQVLHPRTRFYAGGSQSVRGFGENQLGPRVLTIAPDVIQGRRDSAGVAVYAPFPACRPGGDLAQCFALRRGDISDDDIVPRPLGGTTLLEGNVEMRVPIFGALVGALFVDGAILGERALSDATNGTGALSPGVGIRYQSPVGPVRVDVGYRPVLREALPVVTEVLDPVTGERRLLDLTGGSSCGGTAGATGCRVYPQDRASGIGRITRRLTLHLSIGEAF